ncbi:MAG: hypothetical protein A3D74_00370 [Candidatus Levybacteria bacterium RIFCSPHIGHO2_02_FULL_37_13]|nr:MAG: hypothetical protein A3D74_00370 [Candidatus Levybacteria bacterium RIFCSPHIGHO2_02_FULL_37_13]OGH37379.1 MAG: hypothetical protein A3B41_03185 [Candidatus Levybacteria bacterium RIFCSPLOWO2_01_FULL_37_26]
MARIEHVTLPTILKIALSPEQADQFLSKITTNKSNITIFRTDENGELIKETQNPSELLEREDKVTFDEVFFKLQQPTIKIIYQKTKVPSKNFVS